MTKLSALRAHKLSLLLRPSLLWLVFVILSLAIMAIAFYSYRNIDNELTSNALSRRETIANLIAVTLEEKFERFKDIAISLATRERVRELISTGKWNDAIQIMQNIPQELPQIERLFLADVNGTLKADEPHLPGVVGRNFAHRDWYQGVKQAWQPHISSAYVRAAEPRINVLAVTVPVRALNGKVVGILGLQIHVESLLARLQSVDLGKDGFAYIIDSQQQIAFHSKYPQQAGIAPVTNPIREALGHDNQDAQIVFDPVEKEESVIAYSPIGNYGWTAVVQQPTRSSDGIALRNQQLRQILLEYALLLIFLVTAIFLASRFVLARERAAETKHRQAELERRVMERTAELSEANRFLDSLIENIPHMIFVKDAETLRFVRFNRAGEKLLGYTRADLLGKNDYDFFPKEQAEFFIAHDRAVLAEGKLEDIPEEKINTRHQGTRLLHTKKVPLFDVQGRPRNLLGISEDVTAQREKEQEILRLNLELLHQTAEIQAVNKELESFSYSVSHDLRAPLRSIDGFSAALQEDYQEKLDPQGVGYLQRIRAATGRMSRLIDDLLTLSRVTRAELRKANIDLSAMAQSIVTELCAAEPLRSIHVSIQPKLNAEGDPALLRIVLDNLIGNAWKFTKKTEAAKIEFGQTNDTDEPRFFVRDNGAGFDMTYVGKLFTPFQRLHDSSEFPGSGIGLATVQRIIHRHGGRVSMEGKINHGATVYFSLPSIHSKTNNQK